MKKFTLLIALTFIIQATSNSQSHLSARAGTDGNDAVGQACLPEGIYFTTQAQVDSFQINYPNCTEIEGNVNFSGEDITNLDSLNVLTSIEGDLNIGWWISQNPSLISLEGLNNLTNVGGSLRIDRNALLVDLTGLESLTLIGGELRIGTNWAKSNDPIVGNPSLISLTGLDNLSSIGEGISIEANNSLTSLIVLNNITSIGGELIIGSNDALSNLSGLENITLIGGGVHIYYNNSLTSMAGLDNIEAGSIEDLRIFENISLSNCEVTSVCNYLISPNGTIEIHDNAPGCNNPEEVEEACESSCLPEGITFTTQAQIDSFPINYPNCNKVEGYVKIYGDDITNLNGLANLTSIGAILEIGSYYGGCPSLADLSGLESLNSVRAIDIRNNASLLNITGLKNINSIMRQVYIFNNDALTNLSGLEGLETIGGGVSIIDNDVLVNLEGLNNLDSILAIMYGGGNLIIENNKALINLKGLENLKFFADGIDDYESRISIDGNEALVSLVGIEKLEAKTIQLLNIKNNSSLSVCNDEWVCKILSDTTTGIFIENNAPGCNSKAEVDTACKYSFVGEISILDKLLIHPNPFSTSTTITYELQQPSTVKIIIYNHLGKQIKVIEQKQSAGKQQVVWNAEGLPAGVYFCAFKTESGTHTMKMIKLKK